MLNTFMWKIWSGKHTVFGNWMQEAANMANGLLVFRKAMWKKWCVFFPKVMKIFCLSDLFATKLSGSVLRLFVSFLYVCWIFLTKNKEKFKKKEEKSWKYFQFFFQYFSFSTNNPTIFAWSKATYFFLLEI